MTPRLREAIKQDPWIEHGLTVCSTNVVDLQRYVSWRKDHPHVAGMGRVLRSTLTPEQAHRRARTQRATARRLARAEARERRQRQRRKRGGK